MSNFRTPHPLAVAEQWAKAGRAVALATVVDTWSSAPLPTGSQMVVDADGNLHGSLSGGCIEADVVAAAIGAVAGGKARLLEFGVTDEVALAAGLSCGGRIQVYVETRLTSNDMISQLNILRGARKAAVVITDLVDGTERLVVEGEDIGGDLDDAVSRAFRSGKSSKLEIGGHACFLNVHLPSVKIAVIGAVRISQALAPMASLAGFDLTVIDPRGAFASMDGFAGTRLVVGWPRDELLVDRYTALVAVAHAPEIDDGAIGAALRAGCFYVGALGSRNSHAARLQRLRADGFDDADLSPIHAPIGLDIGAANPVEIAVAILAEIIQSLRHRPLCSSVDLV